jgi:predicted PurR-regulated permease PerM
MQTANNLGDPDMNSDQGSKGRSRFTNFVLLACFLALGYLLYLVFRPFLSSLIWATVLTVVFFPAFEFILSKTGGRRSLASFLICLLVLLLIVIPVTTLGVVITQQASALFQSMGGSVDQISQESAAKLKQFQERPWVRRIVSLVSQYTGKESADLAADASQIVSRVSQFLVGVGADVLKGAGGLVFSFFLMFLTMFFLLRDGTQFLELIMATNPLPVEYAAEVLAKFRDLSFATFYGTILTAAVQGAAGGLLLWALGISSPVFWGAVVSLVSLVPIVGTLLIWGPMTAYLLITGHPTKAILLVVLGSLAVGSIDNLLKPMIIRGRTDMHPLLIFMGVLGGMQVFGFLGVLLGPLVVAVFISFLNLYRMELRPEPAAPPGGGGPSAGG